VGLKEWTDRIWAETYDGISFGAINLLQLRHGLSPDFLPRFQAYVDHWRSISLEDFYAVPPNAHVPTLPHSGHFRFSSPHPSPVEENNQVAFDLYPTAGGWTQPTMFIAHGLMSVSDIGYQLWARRLNRRGWNAVFCHLPYHYSRRPRGYLAGELAVQADLIQVVEGVRQAVIETRLLMQALEARGGQKFGVWGTSYGGWISALICCVEPLVQRALLVEPILNIETAIWHSPATAGMRHLLKKHGVGPEHTRPHLRLCCPSHSRPCVNGSHILLMAGEFDKIAHPEEVRRLHEAWPGSHFRIAPQGHVGYTLMPRSFEWALDMWPEDFSDSGIASPSLAALA
jgi:pimeloyl-ACP methyl ester carboxylesterase